jgi:uncharacterized protein YkwD
MTASSRVRPAKRRSVGAILAVVLLALAAAGCMPNDARTFLDRTNGYRQTYGVRSLHENDQLTAKAEAWAQHMAATGVLQHSSLTSGLGGLRYRLLGENVGYHAPTSDTFKTIHDQFLRSSSHRANILNSGYTHMGVGVAKDKYGRVWVAEVFAAL